MSFYTIVIYQSLMRYTYGGGGFNPIFAHGKNVSSHFSPWGKRVKSIHFPLFPYTFFPWGKMGKDTIFPWAKMGLDPPPTYTGVFTYAYKCQGV